MKTSTIVILAVVAVAGVGVVIYVSRQKKTAAVRPTPATSFGQAAGAAIATGIPIAISGIAKLFQSSSSSSPAPVNTIDQANAVIDAHEAVASQNDVPDLAFADG